MVARRLSLVELDSLRAELMVANDGLLMVVNHPSFYVFDLIDDDDRRLRLERLHERFHELRHKYITGRDVADFRLAYSASQWDAARRRLTVPAALRRVAWLLPRLEQTLCEQSTGHQVNGVIQRWALDNPNIEPD